MARVALVTVHGMGRMDEHYHRPLVQQLMHQLGERFLDLTVQPVVYQGVLQPHEDAVWADTAASAPMHYGELRRFLLYGFGDAAGLEAGKDEPGSAYEQAQLCIARALWAARQALGGDAPVVLVSQSLGCQVLSNYFYDAQRLSQYGSPPAAGVWRGPQGIDAFAPQIAGRPFSPAERAFLAGRSCRCWLSTGCNIPLFVAGRPRTQIRPIKPLPLDSADFHWLNLYDPDDVLGWPLQPLCDDYRALVQDQPVNAGRGLVGWMLNSWGPQSHTAYWTDDEVLRPLTAMLNRFLPD